MSVAVVGYRQLIEPPVLGDCRDPECRTVVGAKLVGSAWDIEGFNGVARRERGKDVLLVAQYGSNTDGWTRVCAACDERRLRAWQQDES